MWLDPPLGLSHSPLWFWGMAHLRAHLGPGTWGRRGGQETQGPGMSQLPPQKRQREPCEPWPGPRTTSVTPSWPSPGTGGGAGAAGQVSSWQVPSPDLTASTVPELLIVGCSERASHKRGIRGLVQMLHLHSKRALCLPQVRVFLRSLMRMRGARTALCSFPLDIAAGLGRGDVHEVKGRILLTGGPQLGESEHS